MPSTTGPIEEDDANPLTDALRARLGLAPSQTTQEQNTPPSSAQLGTTAAQAAQLAQTQEQNTPPSSSQLGMTAGQAAAAIGGSNPGGGLGVGFGGGNAPYSGPTGGEGGSMFGALGRLVGGASNASTPPESGPVATPITTAAIGAQQAGPVAAQAGRGGSLAGNNTVSLGGPSTPTAGPVGTGGQVAPQPTPSSTGVEHPATGVPAQAGPSSQPTIGNPTGTPTGAAGPTAPTTAPTGTEGGPAGSQGSATPSASGVPNLSNNPTTPSGQPGDLAQLTSQIQNSLTGLQSSISGNASPDVLNVFVQQGQAILNTLQQQEADLRASAQAKGTTLDPSTQFTLDQMQKQLDGQLRGVKEELNRRGLLDSGIELASENQVRSGNLTAEGSLLSGRLSKIQQDLESGLKSINDQRVKTQQDFGLKGAEAQATADNNTLNRGDALRKSLVDAQLSLRGQQNTNDIARQNEAAQNARLLASQQFTGGQNDLNRQNQRDLAQFNQGSQNSRQQAGFDFTGEQNGLQRQAAAANAAAALAGRRGDIALQAQYQQQAAEANRQFQASQAEQQRQFQQQQSIDANQRAYHAAGSTNAVTDALTTQLSAFPSYEEAMAALQSQMGDIVSAGGDPATIQAAINKKFGKS